MDVVECYEWNTLQYCINGLNWVLGLERVIRLNILVVHGLKNKTHYHGMLYFELIGSESCLTVLFKIVDLLYVCFELYL